MLRKLPLVFAPQPEGGFTVTSPVLPELITEGDTLDEAYANVPDALAAVLGRCKGDIQLFPGILGKGMGLRQAGQPEFCGAAADLRNREQNDVAGFYARGPLLMSAAV